jgi:D-alanyl-D-alanine carboxypeptidase
MKATILYTGNHPREKDISELTTLIPFLDITWEKYTGKIVPDGITQLSWAWLKTLYKEKTDVRCFITDVKTLTKLGIKSHIGLYNLDTDGVHDFYISIPPRLDKRARNNGFKSNFAWIFTHEFLHGVYWNRHHTFIMADGEVHAGEKQGKLKDMLAEYVGEQEKIAGLQKQLTLLQKLLASILPAKPVASTPPSKLLPLVERKTVAIIADMERLGHPVRLVEGFRSIDQQNALYAQGRTTPGAIVTNAKGGESLHQYGIAVDFVFRKEGYNASEALWKKLGDVGRSHGFEWGGDWKGFVDKPHFQMTLGYSLKDFQGGKVDHTKYS